jgi:hypothetical protein
MTIPQQATSDTATTFPESPVAVPGGRGLASAIAVYLGGYLLLASFAGTQLMQVSLNLLAPLAGRPTLDIPAAYAVLFVLQFLFAIVVIVVGLNLGRGPAGGRLLGSGLVVVGSLLTFVVLGARLSGLLNFPGGQAGMPFQMLFANYWFSIVLVVGVAWLISRGARKGWLSLLPVLLLIPLPVVFAMNGIESAISTLVLYLVSGLVGAGIIAAGRPLRD